MPRFYRQNKKRIDPRYFLNETTYRDQLEENLMNPEQRSINARPIYYRLDKLLSKPEFSQYREELYDLMHRVSAVVAKRPNQISDQEFTELISAAQDDSSLKAFDDRVMAMLSQGTMKGDVDSDGDVDPQDVADLAQQVAQGMSNSSFQNTQGGSYSDIIAKYDDAIKSDDRLQNILDLVNNSEDISQLQGDELKLARELQGLMQSHRASKQSKIDDFDDFELETQ